MKTCDLDYELPSELIATRPAEPRDSARLLVYDRAAESIEHARIEDLPTFLHEDDLIVRNDTSVLAARLVGRRAETEPGRGGGRVEGLFLGIHEGKWQVMLSASGRLKAGDVIHLSEDDRCHLTLCEQDGRTWLATASSHQEVVKLLEEVGRTPLPPYILKARRQRGEVIDDEADRRWYATTYARPDRAGSVAAPTAGLHFSKALLEAMRQRVQRQASVTLHVGAGTFQPVQSQTLEEHPMHAEAWSVESDDLASLKTGPGQNGRVIAIGTTTVRVLESLPHPLPEASVSGMADLLISPGYSFKIVDGLLTNFHLPRSTLLALVAALIGLDQLKSLYQEAIRHRYRFYSYGDAMLILP